MTLTVVDGQLAVPAHLRHLFPAATNDDLSAGVSAGFPIISYKGKVWTIVEGETRTLVTDPVSGDPKASIEVVILKANPNVSKVYYEGGFEEGSSVKPTCYSHDGKTPGLDATDPQATKCAICPKNQWGSKVTEQGAKGKACSDSRRLAVAPVGDLKRPMLLRVPAGTLKELVAYADLLNKRQVPYQALVTKIGFDHTVAHQKFTFKPLRFLEEDEGEAVASTLQSETIDQIVGMNVSVKNSVLPPASEDADDFPVPPPPKDSGRRKVSATEDELEAALAAPKAAPPPPPKAEPKPKRDHTALMAGADATLDDILGALDDE